MLDISLESLSSHEELLMIRITPESLSFEAGLIMGLIYNSVKHPKCAMLRFKLFKIFSESPSNFCQTLAGFMQDFKLDNFELILNNSEFKECLPYGIETFKLFIQDLELGSFYEGICKFFDINLKFIGDYTKVSFFGSGNLACIKLAYVNSCYFLVIEKESLADKLIELVESIEDFSDRRKGKISQAIKNFRGIEQGKVGCGHAGQEIKTFCGKSHCLECLKEKVGGKDFKSARCECGMIISPKDYFFIVSK